MKFLLRSTIIAWLSAVCIYNLDAKIIDHRFVVSYFEGAPDGVFKNKILGINGRFPGPTIEAVVGDFLNVELVNNIQDGQNTTLHWHGIHQRGSCFEDGTSQISQCPLKKGKSQFYSFQVNQPGTFWYHSHVNSQYTEGLWGALIVHNEKEIYNYDDEILFTLTDWYHQTAEENEEWHLSPPSLGVPPYPNSGLINGNGRYPCDYAALQNRSCLMSDQKRAVVDVKPGHTYRVRIINTSAVAAFNFSIDGHVLETIEVDGIDIAYPVSADIVPIAAAQRYSFLIRTNKNVDRYLVRADIRKESLMLIEGHNINKWPESLMGDVTAVLQYNPELQSPKHSISSERHSYVDVVPPQNRSIPPLYLQENLLLPYDKEEAPSHVDQEFILYADFFEDHEDIRRGSFNRTPFFLPEDKPLLMTMMDGESIPKEAFPLEVGYMNTIQVVINNPFYGPHPFHLHGHHFWVVGLGGLHDGNYSSEIHELSLIAPKRDTVVVQELSWAVIRFVADNPGLWTFHCHIDWHNLSGMALTFVSAPELFRNITESIPPEADKVCGFHDVELP